MTQQKPETIQNTQERSSLTEAQIYSYIENLDRIVEEKDALLQKMHPFVVELMEARHEEYEVPETLFEKAVSAAQQMYDEPTYNPSFVHEKARITTVSESGEEKITEKGGDLDSRRGGEFNTAAHYDEGGYTQKILEAAQALGFAAPEVPGKPADPIDEQLGIADSYLEPITEPVEAIVIPTAKSISNPMRIRDALRNVENGKIMTNKIIIASCDRAVDDDERQKLDALNLNYGTTEFESGIASFNDFAQTNIDPRDAEPFYVEIGGVLREGKKLVATVELPAGPIELIVVSAPFDEDRVISIVDGVEKKAERANTEENLLAAYEFLSLEPGLIALESHDVWSQSQAEVADQILGPKGKRTVATGPFKLDRLTKDSEGKLILNKPGEVVDEIAKTYSFATKTRVKSLNARQKLMDQLEAIK